MGLVDHLGQGRADEVGDSTALRLEQVATGFTTLVPGCDAGVRAWFFVALETPSASRGWCPQTRRQGSCIWQLTPVTCADIIEQLE